MRTIRRYLYRSLVLPLIYCVSGVLVFWITYDLIDELGGFQSSGLRAVEICQYYFIKLPEVLVTVLPIGLLLALLYTISNHARHNEFTALRAAGVGIWQISSVYFNVGILCGVTMFCLNEFWVPDADVKAEAVIARAQISKGRVDSSTIRLNGFANYRDQRMWQFASLDVDGGVMVEPKVDWRLPDGRYRELLAERAVWTNGYWFFYHVWENTYGIDGGLSNRLYLEKLPMLEFTESPKEMLSQLKVGMRLAHRKVRRAEVPIFEIVNYLRYAPELSPREKAWLLTQLHGRIALPWICVVVVLIALPFSGISGNRAVYLGMGSSVGICFVYFVLQQVGLALGSGGYVPPWVGAWLPNVVFGVVGVIMTKRVG